MERVLLGGQGNISEIWRNAAECLWQSHVGDMEKHGGAVMAITCWRYGETWWSYDYHMLEIWRNMAEQLWRSHVGVR